jgi:hypothetical protein
VPGNTNVRGQVKRSQPTALRCAAAIAACALAACSNSSQSGSNETSSSSSATPAASGSAAGQFTDLTDVNGAVQIQQLAQLGVFEQNSGDFIPNNPITRGEFVRWLVNANNAIWASDPSKVINPSQAAVSSYPDVSTSHIDFPYIQGMYDAGFSIGFEDKTFRPDDPLTREQMIAIKENLDRGGVDPQYATSWEQAMPQWPDRDSIDPQFRGAIAEDSAFDLLNPTVAVENIERTWGPLGMFRPKAVVTRAEAALCIWKIGAHNTQTDDADAPRSAADALAQAVQPSPSPT